MVGCHGASDAISSITEPIINLFFHAYPTPKYVSRICRCRHYARKNFYGVVHDTLGKWTVLTGLVVRPTSASE